MKEQAIRYWNLINKNVRNQDPTTISVLVAVVVVFLTIGNLFLTIF